MTWLRSLRRKPRMNTRLRLLRRGRRINTNSERDSPLITRIYAKIWPRHLLSRYLFHSRLFAMPAVLQRCRRALFAGKISDRVTNQIDGFKSFWMDLGDYREKFSVFL